MNYRLNINPKKVFGKRINLAQQESVTDQIVSAFTVQGEAQPPVPLSSTGIKKGAQVISIIAATLLFSPVFYPISVYSQYASQGYQLSALMYPLLMLGFRGPALLGGIILYWAARRANALRKWIGWTALANVVFPLVGVIAILPYYGDFSLMSAVGRTVYIASAALSLLCMLTLFVLCVLLLIRIFRKKPERQEELPVAAE